MSITFTWVDPDAGETQLGQISASKVKAFSGLGMAPLQHFLQGIPSQHRQLHRGLKFRPRIVQLGIWDRQASAAAQDTRHQTLLTALNPDRGEGTLKIVLNDGTDRRLDCYVQEGPDFASEDRPQWGQQQLYVVRFVARDPFLYNPTQNSESIPVTDDETGGSFGPVYHGLSLVDGAAFFRCQGVDLSGYAGTEGSDTPYVLDITDSAGKHACGVIGAADAAEATPGAELLSNPGFETAGGGGADIWASWGEVASDGALANEVGSVHGGSDAAKITAGASINTLVRQSATVAVGKLYKIVLWTRGDGTYAGRIKVRDIDNGINIINNVSTGVTGTSYAEVVRYVTAPAGCSTLRIELACPATDTGVAYFDDVSVKEVTDVGVDGIHIVSAKDGSTRNWAQIEAGFDYNDDAYTFEVRAIAPTIVATNSGHVGSFPTISIIGPVTNVLLTLGSEVIDINYVLAAGNTMTINCLEGTIELQDETNLIQYLTKASVLFDLERGANSVVISSDTGLVRQASISHYDRFLGL